MSYIIGNEDFIKNLDGWLFKNEQKHANWIAGKKSGIPAMFTKYDGVLYRGMTVDETFFKAVKEGKMVFKAHSSWSKSEKRAKGFVDDPAFIVGNKSNGLKILIKKKIPASSIILDIHSLCMFMGEDQMTMLGLDEMSYDSASKEEEVLVSKGIKIVESDISLL